ncbi:hypothetical protein SDC9_153267 [bioreactor metagenome]|uniref:Uncharacterized protein n=1 Tax=bioreactor metagenome TaxID=1076179 RepID=A0A645F031_9ZZZZ
MACVYSTFLANYIPVPVVFEVVQRHYIDVDRIGFLSDTAGKGIDFTFYKILRVRCFGISDGPAHLRLCGGEHPRLLLDVGFVFLV